MTMAASGHWPMTKAPVTATVISALMFSRPCQQRRQTLLVDIEAGQPDGSGSHRQARRPSRRACPGRRSRPARRQSPAAMRHPEAPAAADPARDPVIVSVIGPRARVRRRACPRPAAADRNLPCGWPPRPVPAQAPVRRAPGVRCPSWKVIARIPLMPSTARRISDSSAGAVHRRHPKACPARTRRWHRGGSCSRRSGHIASTAVVMAIGWRWCFGGGCDDRRGGVSERFTVASFNRQTALKTLKSV